METLKVQRRGMGSLASNNPKEGWVDTTLEEVLDICETTKEVLMLTGNTSRPLAMFEKESVIEQLKSGKIISTPSLNFRAIVGDCTCPLCGATFEEEMGALSRKDNDTLICSTCGTEEAMQEFYAPKK